MEQPLGALARRLGQEGPPATMVFSAQPAAFPGRELRAAGVDVRALDFAHPARAAARLAVWLAVDRPELVHFHFIDPYSRYVRLARLSGARVLVHDHLCPAPGSGLRVAASRYAADAVARAHAVPPARIEVLENGIDLTRFRGVDGTRVRRELGVG